MLKRRLENRHIQLISINGAMGTGLFMGSGKIIALSGTSIILVYAIIGFFVFCIMGAMRNRRSSCRVARSPRRCRSCF